MPTALPAYPGGPYSFEMREIDVAFQTRPAEAHALLPRGAGLEPALAAPDRAEMLAYVAEVAMTAQLGGAGSSLLDWRTPYREAGILVRCRLGGTDGLFCVVMYVDHCEPVVVGRETVGFPKKPAAVFMNTRTDPGGSPARVHGTAIYRGGLVMSAAISALTPVPLAGLPAGVWWLGRPWWLEKVVPRANPSSRQSGMVHELVMPGFAGTTLADPVRTGVPALDLLDGGDGSDDLARAIPVLGLGAALLRTSTFELAGGTTVARL